MMRKRLFRLAALLALLLSTAVTVAAQAPPEGETGGVEAGAASAEMRSNSFGLQWSVAASGGSTMESAHFRLSSTMGQPVAGTFDGDHFSHRAGFWQPWFYRVYLPLVIRGS